MAARQKRTPEGFEGWDRRVASTILRGEVAKIAGAALALVGFGFSVYLTYRELFTIKALCQWCVASAVIMTLLAVITVFRLLRVEQELELEFAGRADGVPSARRDPVRAGL